MTASYPPMKLCAACVQRRCEDRGPDCDNTDICQCPCALAGSPEELAALARDLRSTPFPEEAIRHG
jgi:hypothetical protein